MKIAIFLIFFMTIVCAKSVTVGSLSEIDSALSYDFSRDVVADQYHGYDIGKGLSTILPNFTDKKTLLELIAPSVSQEYNGFLSFDALDDRYSLSVSCYNFYHNDDYSEKSKIYLALFDAENLIAKSHNNASILMHYDFSNLDSGVNNIVIPECFDAIQRVSLHSNEVTFGLYSSIIEGYAGGGGFFRFLSIFTATNGEIREIFSQPISTFTDHAGSWHEDGTRDHHLTEQQNVLEVLTTTTNGYRDIRIVSLDENFTRDFIYDSEFKRYIPRENITNIDINKSSDINAVGMIVQKDSNNKIRVKVLFKYLYNGKYYYTYSLPKDIRDNFIIKIEKSNDEYILFSNRDIKGVENIKNMVEHRMNGDIMEIDMVNNYDYNYLHIYGYFPNSENVIQKSVILDRKLKVVSLDRIYNSLEEIELRAVFNRSVYSEDELKDIVWLVNGELRDDLRGASKITYDISGEDGLITKFESYIDGYIENAVSYEIEYDSKVSILTNIGVF